MERSRVRVISSIACEACLSRIWVAAFATTALPRSEPSTSAGSCVATVRPAECLRLALAIRNRNSAPAGSCISSQASSTTTNLGLRTAGLDTCRHTASRVNRVPIGLSSSARSRSENTTRWPSGRVVVGPENSPENAPVTYGRSCAASSTPPGSPVAARTWARSAISGAGRVQVRGSDVMPTRW